MISFERTRQAQRGLKGLRYYAIGLQNTAVNSQAESYRIMTGPAAERNITAGDARGYAQGHFFGSGVGEGDKRETVGASGGSKIWSNRRCSVAEYIAWTSELNKRLNGAGDIAPSLLDMIQHARTLRQIPETVIAAGWHKQAYRQAPRVRYRQKTSDDWSSAQLTDFEMNSFALDAGRKFLDFEVSDGTFAMKLRLGLKGVLFTPQGTADLDVMSAHDEWLDIATWMTLHPPVFYAGDKSSFQGVNLTPAPALMITKLADGDAGSMDWNGCAIGVEYEIAKAGGLRTVHQALEQRLRTEPNLVCLFYDHRSGEAADFVALIKEDNGNVRVQLYHCKGAGGAPSGTRVGDVYEVAGQMLESVAYCDAGVLLAHMEHRSHQGRHKSPSVFLIGDLGGARNTLDTAPATGPAFEIYGVQPGISLAAIDDHLADLMAFGLDYVHRGGVAKACWLISA